MVDFAIPLLDWPLPAAVGYFCCVVALWSLMARVFPVLRFLRKYCNRRAIIDRCGKGSWAVVTGASYGIGLGFARALAARGFNIVLIARSGDTLRKIADGLELQYGVRTRVLCFDFSRAGSDYEGFYNNLCAQLEEVDVSLLVNNVGWGEDHLFETQSYEKVTQTLELNIWPVTALSRWALEKMQDRANESIVINISSAASLIPLPTAALYSATKQFVHFLTRVLAYEKSLHNVHFMSLRSAFVTTPLMVQGGHEDESLVITIDECAEAALEHVGTAPYTMGHWKHRLARFGSFLIPEGILSKFPLRKYRNR